MNTNLANAATMYVGVIDNEIVCFAAIIQFALKKGKKRVHRLVVLPDYQGVGIGTKFITEIASLYDEKGLEFSLTTSTPSLVYAFLKNENWILTRYGRVNSFFGNKVDKINKTISNKRITYGFLYRRNK